jgi:FtsP/CotA-like multicopper oxidase with cupredoxin domain
MNPEAAGREDTAMATTHHATDDFSQETAGLPEAIPTPVITLGDGDRYPIVAAPVRKRLGDDEVRMLAYNGAIPGPTLRVRQGATVTVDFTNETDLESTIHWHGLRLDNRFDGTTQTQAPVPVGGSFAYQVTFPDPGIYWYHPHIREDYGQEMGLAGTVVVEPAEPDAWAPVSRELVVTLDDVLIEDGRIAPFSQTSTNYVAMGRFGNVLLANGEPDLALGARRGEVVRLYLVNTANTRVFNVGIDGARLKLVGGDSGRVEREAFVDTVLLAPSERAIVDVFFDRSGEAALEHRTPRGRARLATIAVAEGQASATLTAAFEMLGVDAELVAERERIAPLLAAEPDKALAFVAKMDLGVPEGDGPVTYACPMHPDIVSDAPGHCPICGMKLVPQAAPAVTYTCPMHPEIVTDQPGNCPICGMKLLPANLVADAGHGHDHGHHAVDHGHQASPEQPESHESHGHGGHEQHEMHGHGHHGMDDHDAHVHHGMQEHGGHGHHHATSEPAGHGMAGHGHQGHAAGDGIEWEDDMVAVNRITTPANTRWLLVDRDTGASNHGIDWRFRVGDRVKIRLVNEMESDHPMHHPFHVHGAGRFLILARDGAVEPNLAWKDTVLVRAGETVDILLEVTNPGIWMAHCHIAEHHESGMMLHFTVDA